MDKISGIYQIRNTVNGKFYIGSSCNLAKRKYEHFRQLKKKTHPNIILQNSWNKNGNVFEWSILEITDDLLEKEQYYLDKLKPEYNISKEAKRIKFELKGHPREKEIREKYSQLAKNRKFSVETRKKLSEAAKINIAKFNPMKGKKHARKTRDKMVRTHTGLKHCKETKIKIAKNQLGEKGHNAKLTMNQVREMRKLYSTGDYSYTKLGKKYDLAFQTVGKIITNKRYKDE